MEPEKKLSKTQKKAAILEELLKQLKFKGAKTEVFKNLIDDYMRYWDLKEKLQSEIRKHGVVYTDRYGESRTTAALKEIQNVTKIMLAILKEMDLKTGNVGGGEGSAL